ncbi:dihydropteroate synthase-like enzyme [Caldisphaera lagunensis DSM 15908]|uniref:Dihydropteroate synthase-like enzyme n=1 Tax=Caldisphaera lagunensis (strain DSM 15908 / JCM 11604 / ANMR 0165 / IC-154) TaxID=1056495 RepID=L0ABI9_CALLD|nr:dihydropteroate synthase-like protein [Caldisphaera lagunensis]AFZ71263.1 dihydropteroate synthase-like enzyme [Caldisphaera lagunensis DSM 15908]
MKIAVLTSTTAEEMVKDIVTNDNKHGYNIEVVPLPVPVISILDTNTISKIISRRKDILEKIRDSNLVMIPGLVRGDSSIIEKVANVETYKGPKSLGILPYALDFIHNGGKLDKQKSAEEVMGSITPKISYKTAFKIDNIEIPIRGPPVLIVAEIHPNTKVDEVESLAKRYVNDGAKIIIIGSNLESDPSVIEKKIKIASNYAPIIAEISDISLINRYRQAGIVGISTSAHLIEKDLEDIPNDLVLIIGDRNITKLKKVGSELLSKGYKLIIDPVLGIPCIDFVKSINRYTKIIKSLNAPILFSAADVTEELEADTIGIHSLLATISIELRASLYLVVEETYKSHRGVAEAREALRVAETAYSLKSTPRGLFSKLLVVKQNEKPITINDQLNYEYVNYIPPDYNLNDYIQISVDYEKNEIKVVYKRNNKILAALKGKHAMSLARELVKRVNLSLDHAAYLGYELSKAEIALKLGKTYIQDESIIIPPWMGENGE